MQIVGFNFTKVLAERKPTIGPKTSINTNIEFLDLSKEEIDILKDQEALKITFNFSVIYSDTPEKEKPKEKTSKEELGKISFEGVILLTSNSEEIKNLLKSWKKKEIPNNLKVPLFNLILKRCSTKALDLEEQLNLPSHIPFPQITLKPKEGQSS